MAPSPRRESAQVLAKVITKDLASPELYKLCFPDKVIVEDYKKRKSSPELGSDVAEKK